MLLLMQRVMNPKIFLPWTQSRHVLVWQSLGAEPWNFQTDREGLDERVKSLTDGRGADVVIGK